MDCDPAGAVDSDTTATFDVAMDSYEAAQGGLITDMWVALTLTVGVSDGATVIRFYYDGNEVGSDLSRNLDALRGPEHLVLFEADGEHAHV